MATSKFNEIIATLPISVIKYVVARNFNVNFFWRSFNPTILGQTRFNTNVDHAWDNRRGPPTKCSLAVRMFLEKFGPKNSESNENRYGLNLEQHKRLTN